jgi:type II secretion system protein G
MILKKGFTLIELLIVVLIIAILAAIAVPNFLEAQIRSKVSRAKADMRTITTAIESYFVDHNQYPNDCEHGWPWYPTYLLTTPISYLGSRDFVDPFLSKDSGGSANYYKLYRYINYLANNPDAKWRSLPDNDWRPSVSTEEYAGGLAKYGFWRLSSVGPDRFASYDNGLDDVSNTGPGWPWFSNCMVYDPTNGTISCGDIMRCQKTGDVWSIESAY